MINYFIGDYLILVLVLGFLVLLTNNMKVDQNKSKRLKVLLLTVTAITISSTLEEHFSTLSSYNYGRLICSFICYSLRPIVVITFISLLSDNKIIKYFYGLSVINTLIYSTCFFTDIAFGFSSDNHFYGGPLRFSTHIVCIFYLLLLIVVIIKKHNRQSWNRTIMLSYITFTCAMAAVLDYEEASNLFDQTILICVLLYYLFLYMEFNKVDALTGIFNRRSFYNDIEKFKSRITSVISLDMNNLKLINDKYGHLEGDKALVTLADVLVKSEKSKARFYRVGGDEFVIVCINADEERVKSIINRIKEGMKKTDYSCSIGYEMVTKNKNINDTYKIADDKMYREKERFHKKNK
jgi:diguanylate cyclase (GGDEF)-like protein